MAYRGNMIRLYCSSDVLLLLLPNPCPLSVRFALEPRDAVADGICLDHACFFFCGVFGQFFETSNLRKNEPRQSKTHDRRVERRNQQNAAASRPNRTSFASAGLKGRSFFFFACSTQSDELGRIAAISRSGTNPAVSLQSLSMVRLINLRHRLDLDSSVRFCPLSSPRPLKIRLTTAWTKSLSLS